MKPSDISIDNFEQIQHINSIQEETFLGLCILGFKKGVEESSFKSSSTYTMDMKLSQGLFW